MTPTMELRFVERKAMENDVWQGQPVIMTLTLRILQQKWIAMDHSDPPDFEWRDVPVVKEGEA